MNKVMLKILIGTGVLAIVRLADAQQAISWCDTQKM
jgi:hypothetical protein